MMAGMTSRRADMFIELAADSRADPPPRSDERDVSWEVVADPGGHEFCVLTPC
jgi:hypothetical protein